MVFGRISSNVKAERASLKLVRVALGQVLEVCVVFGVGGRAMRALKLMLLAAGLLSAEGLWARADEPSGHSRLLTLRAAQVDAMRRLAEQVGDLRIDSRTVVRDFLAESNVMRTKFGVFLRAARQVGEPRWYSDGECDVDYEISVETVIAGLKYFALEYGRGGRFSSERFDQIEEYTHRSKIQVTGRGAAAVQPAMRRPVPAPLPPRIEDWASAYERSTSRRPTPDLGWQRLPLERRPAPATRRPVEQAPGADLFVAGRSSGLLGPNRITFDNQSGEPAAVALVGPSCRTVLVPDGRSASVTVASGEYYFVARYGSDPEQYRYGKGTHFTVSAPPNAYAVISITLHTVTSGNYVIAGSSREEFQRALRGGR